MVATKLLRKWKYVSPIVLHIDNYPTFSIGLIKCFVELPDRWASIIGPFSRFVVVVDEQREARRLSSGRPLQHLQVAVGIAKRRDRPAANMLLDGRRFFDVVVNDINLVKLD